MRMIAGHKRQKMIGVSPVEMVMIEQEDFLMLILGFLDVPKLVHLKMGCCRWREELSNGAIENELPISGRRQFAENQHLIDVVRKQFANGMLHAECLASNHSWPIGTWDASRMTNFSFLTRAILRLSHFHSCLFSSERDLPSF